MDSIGCALLRLTQEELFVLAKVFPITLKPGKQAEVEAIVKEFAPKGPAPGARHAVVSGLPRPEQARLSAVRRALRRPRHAPCKARIRETGAST